ncbi:MAG TPA: Ni-sirohydrochlorin a,c-diamide synthase [Candidatus Acidoferrales bacterium]|nr:Ni-sirohydrochlorin a,c-diamide synthase [Candidatus Acidoferrales bacterium]
MNISRLLLSADRSSAGKTTVAVGLISVLSQSGFKIQPFKVGLDYIDPSYHTAVAGRSSRNLDGFLMDERAVRETFLHAVHGSDMAIIEGVRGLYEGFDSLSDVGSTAQIAKILKTPVILLIDARSITRSTAAVVMGYKAFDPEVDIQGVILNKIGSPAHGRKAAEAIQHYTGVEVIGQIPRSDSLTMTMRHLGLVPAIEGIKRQEGFQQQLSTIEEVIRSSIDIDRVVEIAQSSEPLDSRSPQLFRKRQNSENNVTIGIAYDEAFNFYYSDMFDLLRLNGAGISFFSPLRDDKLPDIDGIYIGGGYPELFASELESNKSMRVSMREASEAGMPIYAECGGLMYLTESLAFNSKFFKMVGVVPALADVTYKRTIGYTVGRTISDTIIGPKGTEFRGHEFHYSEVKEVSADLTFALKLERGKGISNGYDGIKVRNTLASYSHLHPLSYPNLASNFIKSCVKFKNEKEHKIA